MSVLVSTETGSICKQSLNLCTYGGAPTVTNSFLIVFFCRLPSRVPPPPPRSPSARPARWSPSRGTSAARTPSASTSPRTSSGPSAGWGTRRRTRQSAASTGRYATKVTRFPHLFFKKKEKHILNLNSPPFYCTADKLVWILVGSMAAVVAVFVTVFFFVWRCVYRILRYGMFNVRFLLFSSLFFFSGICLFCF